MSYEVEQKYRVTDPDEVLQRLSALGAQAKATVFQTDTYYAHPQRDFAATDEALRLRRVGDSNWLTYKGPKLDATTKTRREIELAIAPGETPARRGDELLVALGFRRVAEVRKSRQTFFLQRAGSTLEVALDHVDDLGGFVELEIMVDREAAIEPARQTIAALADALKLSQVERRSYLELLLDSADKS